MSSRTLALAALGLVLLLAGAFWVVHDALPGSGPGSEVVVAEPPPPDAAPALPDVALSPTGLARPDVVVEALDGVPDVDVVVDAASLATGRVSGRLVDAGGQPVVGEPLDLVLVRDPWFGGSQRRNIRVLSQAVSDADGCFSLAARPGSEHELVAGGERFPRHRTEGVASGDELRIVLQAPRWAAGTVVDEETGEPVAGAHVAVMTENERLVGQTDAAGRFRLGPHGGTELFVGAIGEGYDVGFVKDPPVWQAELEIALPAGGTLEGLVFDQETDEPVVGAAVHFFVDLNAILVEEDGARPGELLVLERECASDEQGRFVLEGVPSIGFMTAATAEGYVPREFDRHVVRQVRAGDVVKLALRPVPVVEGQVVAGDRGVAGASVFVTSDDTVVARTSSDDDGRFSLTLDAWDGTPPLAVTATDTAGRSARQRLGKSSGEELVLTLIDPVGFTVAVTAEGQPRSGAHVAVFSSHSAPTLGVTDADGLLVVEHPLSGVDVEQVLLRVRYGGVEGLPVRLELGDEALPDPVLIDLDLGEWFVGRVLDSYGQPVSGARVSVRRGPFGHTDTEGQFRIGPVDPEQRHQWSVTVNADGYRARKLDVPPGGPAFDVVLEPVVRWEGRVVDASTGAAPERWAGVLEIESWRDDRRSFKRTSQRLVPDRSDFGAFSVMLPTEGRFRILVEAPDAIPLLSPVVDFDGYLPPPYAELLLFPAAVLELQIEDGAGRPVAGYGVDVIDWERARTVDTPGRGIRRKARSGRSKEDGRIRINLGEGGSYRIAGGGPHWLEPGRLSVPPGPAVQRRYSIGPSGDLRVDVVDAFGVELATRVNLKASLRTADRKAAHAISRHERAGGRAGRELLFETIPVGRYRVTVKSKGFGTRQEVVDIVGGRLNHLRVALEPVDPASSRKNNAPPKPPKNRRVGAGR